MGSLLTFFGAGGIRLQALIIAALAMAVMILGLTTWALLERSGRLSAKVELVAAQAQAQAWEAAAGRCTASVENAAKIGRETVDATRELLRKADAAYARNAGLIADIRTIVSKPPPVRTDGKPKDCTDALGEIKQRVRP